MIDLALHHSLLSQNYLPLGFLVSLVLNCQKQSYELWSWKGPEGITFSSIAHMMDEVFLLITFFLEEAEGGIMWWSWADFYDPEIGSKCDMNLPFIFFLYFAHYKAVLGTLIFFRDCYILRRELLVVHGDGILSHYLPGIEGPWGIQNDNTLWVWWWYFTLLKCLVIHL